MNNADDLKKEFPYAMNDVSCGAYHPRGWNNLVKEAVEILDRNRARVVQTKEKFGGLRIYFEFDKEEEIDSNIRKECNEAVRIAEDKASKTCSGCGEVATIGVGKMSYAGPSCAACAPKSRIDRS